MHFRGNIFSFARKLLRKVRNFSLKAWKYRCLKFLFIFANIVAKTEKGWRFSRQWKCLDGFRENVENFKKIREI